MVVTILRNKKAPHKCRALKEGLEEWV